MQQIRLLLHFSQAVFLFLALCGCQTMHPIGRPLSPTHHVQKPPLLDDVDSGSNENGATDTNAASVVVQASSKEATKSNMVWFAPPLDLEELSKLRGRDDLSLVSRLLSDQRNFYSPESLTLLGGGLMVGGAIANSSADQSLQHVAQSAVINANSDDWFESLHASKELGDGRFTLPVFASAWMVGELLPDSKIAEVGGLWGERSLRGFLVGAPPLLALQQLTGGSRPTESPENSEWHPLTDNNGISGHAFMGSLPFITAAKMSDRPMVKASFYAASTIAPLSRVNDNAHYPSQVALGWWMAYLAASAVDATDHPNSRWKFYPYSTGTGTGILAEFKY